MAWASAHPNGEVAGQALDFTLTTEDGREFRVEVAGAAWRLAVRDEIEWTKTAGNRTERLKYRVGWIAPGDEIAVKGDVDADNTPYRHPVGGLRATRIADAVPGASALEALSLDAGTPE